MLETSIISEKVSWNSRARPSLVILYPPEGIVKVVILPRSFVTFTEPDANEGNPLIAISERDL